MNKLLTLTIGTIALGLSACATTETASPAPEVAQPAPAKEETQVATAEDDKLICKQSGRTGTRLRASEVCRTAAEWERERELAQTDMDDLTDNRSVAGN